MTVGALDMDNHTTAKTQKIPRSAFSERVRQALAAFRGGAVPQSTAQAPALPAPVPAAIATAFVPTFPAIRAALPSSRLSPVAAAGANMVAAMSLATSAPAPAVPQLLQEFQAATDPAARSELASQIIAQRVNPLPVGNIQQLMQEYRTCANPEKRSDLVAQIISLRNAPPCEASIPGMLQEFRSSTDHARRSELAAQIVRARDGGTR